jgi:hypothetical protein
MEKETKISRAERLETQLLGGGVKLEKVLCFNGDGSNLVYKSAYSVAFLTTAGALVGRQIPMARESYRNLTAQRAPEAFVKELGTQANAFFVVQYPDNYLGENEQHVHRLPSAWFNQRMTFSRTAAALPVAFLFTTPTDATLALRWRHARSEHAMTADDNVHQLSVAAETSEIETFTYAYAGPVGRDRLSGAAYLCLALTVDVTQLTSLAASDLALDPLADYTPDQVLAMREGDIDAIAPDNEIILPVVVVYEAEVLAEVEDEEEKRNVIDLVDDDDDAMDLEEQEATRPVKQEPPQVPQVRRVDMLLQPAPMSTPATASTKRARDIKEEEEAEEPPAKRAANDDREAYMDALFAGWPTFAAGRKLVGRALEHGTTYQTDGAALRAELDVGRRVPPAWANDAFPANSRPCAVYHTAMTTDKKTVLLDGALAAILALRDGSRTRLASVVNAMPITVVEVLIVVTELLPRLHDDHELHQIVMATAPPAIVEAIWAMFREQGRVWSDMPEQPAVMARVAVEQDVRRVAEATRDLSNVWANLNDYQKCAVERMVAREAGKDGPIKGLLVALETGMGKTRTALAAALMAERTLRGHDDGQPRAAQTLVVCPVTLMRGWVNECLKLEMVEGPELRILVQHPETKAAMVSEYQAAVKLSDAKYNEAKRRGDANAVTYFNDLSRRQRAMGDRIDVDYVGFNGSGKVGTKKYKAPDSALLAKFDIVLINPEGVIATAGTNVTTHPWHRIIVDESHKSLAPSTYPITSDKKNHTFVALMALQAQARFALTASPCRTKRSDIVPQIMWCDRREGKAEVDLQGNRTGNLLTVEECMTHTHIVRYGNYTATPVPATSHVVTFNLTDKEETVMAFIMTFFAQRREVFKNSKFAAIDQKELKGKMKNCVNNTALLARQLSVAACLINPARRSRMKPVERTRS